MRSLFLVSAICVAVLSGSPLLAAPVTFMESGGNELSSNHLVPTNLGTLEIGNNTVQGTVTQVGQDFMGTWVDFQGADIFSFEVAAGTRINEIFLRSFTSSSNLIFMAIDDQNTFQYSSTQINTTVTSANLTANMSTWGTIGEPDDVDDALSDPDSGTNLFDLLIGSENSLDAGNYTVYLQETGPSSSYTLNFRVSAVPEPSTSLALLPLGYAVYRFRRKRSSKK
ncbi:hypothetical protein Pla22_17850 [Rubripirellula amarantea]|uniref:PEP-CTERM protein-sorting domain-containing protein n=1 Tax=Rubripirellula amarantea TaxID=2527999 RepID=A0A5C5WUD5_9BACT|nr:PEP-CTERM sorting domain-containing protein [Rubripirellula amarantea]TWT54150.1 hypothetical protein Pla22_17850 [Rubripirellula amarantea]